MEGHISHFSFLLVTASGEIPNIMSWKQELVFIGSAVVIGLVTTFLVRLVYEEDISEGAPSTGRGSGHHIKATLPPWVSVSVYLWLKLLSVLAKILKCRYMFSGFRIVNDITQVTSIETIDHEIQIVSDLAVASADHHIDERASLVIETEAPAQGEVRIGGHRAKHETEYESD